MSVAAKVHSMSDDTSSYLAWMLAGVGTVVATLAGVVAQFYKKQIFDSEAHAAELGRRITHLESACEKQTAEVKDCHKQREEIRVELAEVKTRLSILEAKNN